MEHEGSLQHSQQPATCPHSGPDQSSPYLPTHFFKIHLILSNIILPSTPRSSKCILSSCFLPKPCMHLLSHNACYTHRPSHSSWLEPGYVVRITDHEVPRYVAFIPRPSQAQISFSAPYSRTLSAYFMLSVVHIVQFHAIRSCQLLMLELAFNTNCVVWYVF